MREKYKILLSPGDAVDDGELEERGEDEECAAEEPDVEELDVADLGQLVVPRVVGQRDESQPSRGTYSGRAGKN